MATVKRRLPGRPHLDIPKREARELLDAWRKQKPDAFERIRVRHPKFKDTADGALTSASIKLSDAQLVVAREYGLESWTALKQRIAARDFAGALQEAIEDDDRDTVVSILRANPEMLHLAVRSGNWGPPMSHAANLGRLDIVRAVSELGARDHQHASERALLQGQIECARWLHAHGAKLTPGIILGCCETLKLSGFKFLLELGAPITNERGDRLAPLALVLETYARDPAGKHAILDLFAQDGYELPGTPMMAFHRGDVVRLGQFLREDRKLIEHRFTLREIYPAECGCLQDGRTGMHWTPVDGTTLLHLAIDFREKEIFEWLLANGADVNARAAVQADGFGGHTPLFNAVVSGPWKDATYVAALLERGANRNARANLRKFLDWCEQPRWHEARDVTPVEWANNFPERNWINSAALEQLKS